MTNLQRHLLERMYPNCFSEQRFDDALQRSSDCYDRFERLDRIINELSDECLYALDDIESIGFWVRKYTIEKTTPKRVYVCSHGRKVHERLILDRQRLEAEGQVWHRGTYQRLYTAESIRPRLSQQRGRAADSIMDYYHLYHEMQRNYGERGVALTDEELRIATQLVGDIIDEEMEAYLRPTCTTTHNWLEEGF